VDVRFGDKTLPFLPSPQQELLLTACLFEGEDALTAWQAWRDCVNLDEADVPSMRLLPLLADRLQDWGIKDTAFHKFRGFERRTWVHNHLLFLAAGLALRRLSAAPISVTALSGVVLATTFYATMSLRPMDEVDLFVRPADVLKALNLMADLGWREAPGQFRPHTPAELAVRPFSALHDPANPGVRINLHWRLFQARFDESAEAAFREQAVRFEIDGAECLAPCAADLLLRTCVQGAMWSDVPPVQWVIDAAFLVRSRAVDWSHLYAQTERLGVALPLIATLNYLRTVMRVPLPDSAMQRLTQTHVKSIERLIYESGLQPPDQLNLLAALRIHRHIAWNALARFQGPRGYWRYLWAMRGGRSFPDTARSVLRRLVRSANS
jgi:hypothetical protein